MFLLFVGVRLREFNAGPWTCFVDRALGIIERTRLFGCGYSVRNVEPALFGILVIYVADLAQDI